MFFGFVDIVVLGQVTAFGKSSLCLAIESHAFVSAVMFYIPCTISSSLLIDTEISCDWILIWVNSFVSASDLGQGHRLERPQYHHGNWQSIWFYWGMLCLLILMVSLGLQLIITITASSMPDLTINKYVGLGLLMFYQTICWNCLFNIIFQRHIFSRPIYRQILMF